MRAAYLLLVPLAALSLVRAEEVQLKDGSKITGKILASDGVTFQVKTAYGEIKVPRTEILNIQFPENGLMKNAPGTTASDVNESLDGTLYSNRSAHFQVSVPAGWLLAPSLRQKDVVAALKSPDEAHFLMVTPEVYSGSLLTYRVLAETQYQSKFQDYQKVSESEIKLDGRNGLRLVWRGKTRDSNINAEFLVYIIAYEGRMVRLSFYTLEPLFSTSVPMFEKIAASYHSVTDGPVAQLAIPPKNNSDLASLK